jgi:hypothetical protein
MSAAFAGLLDRMDEIEEAARTRLGGGEGTPAPMNVGAVLMLFEAQRFSDQPAGGAAAQRARRERCRRVALAGSRTPAGAYAGPR